MQAITVYLIEDDYDQADDIIKHLAGQSDIEVVHIATEARFRRDLREIIAVADVVILDVMIDWTSPDECAPIPEEVRSERAYEAGIRCMRMLRAEASTAIPIIFYTHCSERDLEDYLGPAIAFLEKDLGDPRPLLDLINRFRSGGETVEKTRTAR
jgi:CheY-like chemotaxis protein